MPDYDLKTILRGWFVGNERFGEKFGFLGKIVSGSYEVETGDGRNWVTLDDGTAIKAINKKVVRKPGIRVIVKPNRDGEMEIQGINTAQMLAATSNNAAAIATLEGSGSHGHFIGSGNEDPVESRRFMPGLLRAFSGLTVYIESFPYDYNGIETRWNGGSIDLTSNRPATTDYWAWVKVGINPATNAAVATTGTEKPLRALLTNTELDAINFDTSGYIPCGGVILQEGQTASPIETDFAEARDFIYYLDPARPPALGGTTPAAGTFTDVTANRYALTAATTLTIAAGVVTATKGYHLIDAESGTTDDLDTINGMPARSYLIIQAASGDTIAVKHGTGNIFLNGAANFSMSGDKTLLLYNDGTNISDVGAGGSGSASPWQTTSNVVNLVTSTDNVNVGGSANIAKLGVTGDADEVQLAVQANSSQSANLFEVRTDAGADLMTIDNTGDIVPGSDAVRSAGQAAKRFSNGFFVNIIGDVQTTRVKNNSGATANVSDVGYILYSATNGAEYKTTTTANLNASWCVVVRGAADGSDIYVARAGVVSVKLNANCAIGDFLATSTTAGQAATLGTTMRPEMFAIALSANASGAGGTCTARLYCHNAPPVYIGNANDIYGHTGVSTQAFTSTISGAPSATSVVYGAVVTGAENVIVPSAAGQIGLARLWNTTRNTYRLITAVNTGTNTITTVSTTDAWANGDNITIESQTTTTGAAFKVTEIDLNNSNNNNTVVPLLARAIFLNMYQLDTGAAGTGATYVHEYSSYAVTKLLSAGNQNGTAYNNVFIQLPLIGQVFGITQVASGAGTGQGYYRLYGYVEAAP